jgi:hypothetical protein
MAIGSRRVGDDHLMPASHDHPGTPRGGRIVPSVRVVPIEHAGTMALVDMHGGHRVMLDTFGRRVWPLLADQPTLPLLVERLRDEAMRADLLAEDVTRLLARWLELGLIAWR